MRRSLLLCLSLVLCLACDKGDVTSRHPITEDDVGEADPRLEGLWQLLGDPPAGERPVSPPFDLVHLQKVEGPRLAAGWITPSHLRVGKEWIGAISGQVGGRWYVSVYGYGQSSPSDSPLDFRVFRCDFEGDGTLRLRRLSAKVVGEAVRSGALKGKFLKEGNVRVTASTEELAAWVTGVEPFELAEPYLVLRRVQLPVPPEKKPPSETSTR
jgi:hypothetical protein